MTTIYRCDKCGKEFDTSLACTAHEMSHSGEYTNLKYYLLNTINDICDYCKHSYYVYGCEQDCQYKDCNWNNHYKDFIPVEPLHNKRASGGV